jgi:hypothetical protein
METKPVAVACLSIVVIGCLEVFAMWMGHDGWLMTMAVTAIAGIGGYNLRGWRNPLKP